MALIAFAAATTALAADPVYYDVARGSHPNDVAAAPTPGGPVYYTAQSTGKLGILNPVTGKYDEVALGARSSPHGVVVGPDGALWITDGGQNVIVRVDPVTRQVCKFPLPADFGYANLNTLTFDRKGRVWFTGQSGIYGKVDPATGEVKVWQAPRGRIWVSYWNTGQVGMYDPAARTWREWKLPCSRNGPKNVARVQTHDGSPWGNRSK